MHTIISIAVLMAMAHTQTLDSCTEYCNLLEYNHAQLHWRPDCVCSLEYQGSHYRNNKPTKLHRHPPLDNTAIYYEPSDEYPYDRTSFVAHPFYIVNPTFRKQSFKNTENRKARKIHINNRAGELNHPIKTQKPSDSAERSFDIETGDLPLYLDIDVDKSVKNGRSNNMKKIEITEDDLIECIDLHILVYSRKSDQDADLKYVWDETKINKYKDLSDSDLMIEIQSKCHQPTKIVHESLKEIKNSWPRKSQLRSSQDIITKKHFDQNEKKCTEIVTDPKLSDSTTEGMVDKKVVKIPLSAEEPIEMISLLPTTTDFTNFNTNFDSSNIISEVNWSADFSTEKNVAVTNVMESTPELIESNYNEGKIDNVFENDMNFDGKNDSLAQYSNQVLAVAFESTTVFDSDTFFSEFGETESPEFLTKNDIKTTSYQSKDTDTRLTDKTTSTSPNVRDRPIKIIEKDIKIPRIITKELKNDTVISSINGTEVIPNSDFVEQPMITHDPINEYLDEISTTKMTTIETVLLNDFFESTTNDPLNILTHNTNKNEAIKSSIDFTTASEIHHDEEKLNNLNSDYALLAEFPSTNISLINVTLTSGVKKEDFNNPDFSHIENVHNSNRILNRPDGIYLFLPNDSNKNINNNTNNLIANETQIGEEILINPKVSSDMELNKIISLDNSPLYYSNKNDMQAKESDASSVTSQDSWSLADSGKNIKQNNGNGKGSTPELELFSNRTQKAQQSTNYEARELFNNNTIPPKEERNYAMSQNFPQPSATMNYSNLTDEMTNVTQYFSSEDVSSDFPSYTSIPNTSQSDEDATLSTQDVSDIFDDLISSENNDDRRMYSPTTDEPHYLETLDSSAMKKTISTKEDESQSQDAIVGKLYFLFGKKQVPVRFVQNSDGKLSLGLDGKTLCDKIIQKDSNGSVLMKALCNCVRSKNCMNIN